jgi:hypothetical protein
MRRKTQTQVFKSLFPHVDLQTTQGMLMFQGFLAGYNRGIEQFQTDRVSFKAQMKTLKTENAELTTQLNSLNVMIQKQNDWMKTGDEL